MCIAILNKTNKLPLDTFKTCWEANPDGGGFAYHNGKNIVIVKEMVSVDVLHSKYMEAREQHPAAPFAIHFRIATHGLTNLTNCHPFKINKHSAFIHNGVISACSYVGEFSDTFHFNNYVMKELPQNWKSSAILSELLSGYIGGSKLVIIDRDGATIINENLGKWDDGDWYSNKSYLPPIISTYTYQRLGDHSQIFCEGCGKKTVCEYSYYIGSYLCKKCSKVFQDKDDIMDNYWDN